MKNFKTLLEESVDRLEKFKNKELTDIYNSTGIEDCLVQPYLDHIIDMNKHLLTFSSTNYPAQIPFFQKFFVEGYCKLETAEKLEEQLHHKFVYVVYYNLETRKYMNNSDEISNYMEYKAIPNKIDPNHCLLFDKKFECLENSFMHNSREEFSDIFIIEQIRRTGEEEILDHFVDVEEFKGDNPIVHIQIMDSFNSRKDLYKMINDVLENC